MVSFSFAQQKHKVKSGETIYGIAKKYQVKEKAIFDANPKIKNKPLQIGVVLTIPKDKKEKDNTAKGKEEKPKTYTVQKGDSYYAIAKKYAIKVRDLVEANPKVDPNRIKPGMVLNLIKPKKLPSTSKQEEVSEEAIDNLEEAVYQDLIHVVKKGETLSSISRQYDISVDSLRTLNPNLTSVLPQNYQLLIKRGIGSDEDTIVAQVEEIEQALEDEDYSDIPTYESIEKTEQVLEAAKQFLGTRYRYGGRTTSGIDCSGLVCESFNAAGLVLPRTSSKQLLIKKLKRRMLNLVT